ncbi:MAG: helix-turn-helix transcriptional regulator [Candidatus Pristimantibacillus sp.]
MKIDRLLAMTVLLLNHERISAKELADRFEVSTKTIYRDMEALNQSGIPIVAHQGTSGGFEIMEHYTINRQYLTLAEISSLVAAVKGIHSALNDDMIANLLDKVTALLSRADRKETEKHGAGIVFDFNPWGQGPLVRDKVNLLKQAIEETRQVEFDYTNMNGTASSRVVEPAALILKGHLWYLQAYCTLRQEFRVFRLSRVHKEVIGKKSFERRQAPSLEGYSWDPAWSSGTDVAMVLTFHPQVRHRIEDTFSPDQVSILDNGFLQVKGLFTADEWFYGMLLSYGDDVKVEHPAAVAEEIVKRAHKIIERYVK